MVKYLSSSQPTGKLKESKLQTNLKRKASAVTNTGKGKKLLKTLNNSSSPNLDHAICQFCSDRTDKTDILENECILTCAVCDFTFHGTCLKLEDHVVESFPMMSEFLAWVCTSCITKGRQLLHSVKADAIPDSIGMIREQVNTLSNRIGTLEQSITALTLTSMQNPLSSDSAKPQDENSNPWFRVGNSQSSSVLSKSVRQPSGITDVLTAVHAEMSDVNKRKSNILVYGLRPDSRLSDNQLFAELCSNHLLIDVPIIKSSRRLGKILPDRIRHLLVTLSTEDDVNRITSVAKRLRDSSDSVIKHSVYLNRDLTKSESQAAFLQRQKKKKSLTTKMSAPSNSNVMDIEFQDSSSSSLPLDSHDPRSNTLASKPSISSDALSSGGSSSSLRASSSVFTPSGSSSSGSSVSGSLPSGSTISGSSAPGSTSSTNQLGDSNNIGLNGTHKASSAIIPSSSN